MSKFINKKAAVVALAAVAVLGGGVAAAYPPDKALDVSATASSDGTTSHVVVTVDNANPACDTQVAIEGSGTVVIPATHSNTTTVTTTFDVAGLTGRHSVTARTEGCLKGAKEHAKSKFVVLSSSSNITYPASAKVRTSYVIQFSGLTPTTTSVSVIATGPTKQASDSDTVDKRGDASLKLKFREPGTWTLVTTVTTADGSTSETKTVVVAAA